MFVAVRFDGFTHAPHDPGVCVSPEACWPNLQNQATRPDIATLPEFFSDGPLDRLQVEGCDAKVLFERLVTLEQDTDIYFSPQEKRWQPPNLKTMGKMERRSILPSCSDLVAAIFSPCLIPTFSEMLERKSWVLIGSWRISLARSASKPKHTDLAEIIEQFDVGEAFVQTTEMATCARVRMRPLT